MYQKDIKTQIIDYFFMNPTAKLRVREIERTVKVPLPSVIRYVKELCGEGILQKVNIGNVTFYTADRTSSNYLISKRLFNVRKLYESGLVDYIKDECHNPAMVVFGSYSMGEDIEKSDVDIFIQASKVPSLKIFERKLNRSIQTFNAKSLRELRNKELMNSIINGVVVNGFLEVL